MILPGKERKAAADLAIAMAVAIVLAFLDFALNFGETFQSLFPDDANSIVAWWVVNGLFAWLVALLITAYWRWRGESRRRAEFADIISSISPDALIVVSPDRRIEMCNQSVTRIFGYRQDEVINQETDLLYFDRRQDKNRTGEIRDVLEREGFHVGLATGRRADGTTIPLEIITGKLSGRGGAVLLMRDISERVRNQNEREELEARVRQRQKLESLGILAGGVAHDFNNLLTGILGNADLVLAQADKGSRARHHAEGIKTAAIRAAELCRHLLSYSGKGEFVEKPLNLSTVAREMGHLLDVSIPKNVRVVYNLAQDLPSVTGDPAQIRQVIMNFITNASDAIGTKAGEVAVRTGMRHCNPHEVRNLILDQDLLEGDYVFLEVRDTGCGMDVKTLQRIFDPFFTTKVSGRGLGLAAVLGIVRSHRGCVLVQSEPGKGSVFTVLFPRSDESLEPEETPQTVELPTAGQSVLLADDEEVVRRVGTDLLEVLGYRVVLASDGAEAVALFRQHAERLAFVLLDMTMPNMSGLDAMKAIQEIRPGVPVILSSGYSRDATIRHESGVWAPAFIQKPYELKALRQVIHEVLTPGSGH